MISSSDVPRGTSQNSDFSEPTSQKPDFSQWLTKQQAAAAIGVSTKTIEQFAKDGKIQQASWKPHNRGAAKAVYQPDDVARIAAQKRPGLQPFVLPASVTPPSNGNGHATGIRPINPIAATPTGEEILRLVFAAALQALTSENSGASEKSSEKPAYVDKAQALAIAGVSDRELRAAVQAGEVKQRGRRYRRQDLEQL